MLTHIYLAMLTMASPLAPAASVSKAPVASVTTQGTADSDEWKPVLRLVEQGDKLVEEGLLNARHTVRARKSHDAALAKYATASRRLQDVLDRRDDAETKAEAQRIARRIADSATAATLNAANALTVQTNYRAALDRAGSVLAKDPDNADAKALIRTIQLAQASSWGWGWGSGVAPGARNQ